MDKGYIIQKGPLKLSSKETTPKQTKQTEEHSMSKVTRNVTKELDSLFVGQDPITIIFDTDRNPHIFHKGKELHQTICGGSKERGRYLSVCVNKTNYLVHRLVGWWMVHTEERYKHLINEAWETHHIDHNPQNNSQTNLLVLTRSEHTILHNRERAEKNQLKKILERLEKATEEVKAIKEKIRKIKGGR